MAKLTPLKAIRKKCLDCCDNSTKEIKDCPILDCHLHVYRLGNNPKRAGTGGKGNATALRKYRESKKQQDLTQDK